MSSKTEQSNRFWWLLGAAAVLGVLYVFRTILIYLIIAVVISFIGDPIVELLRKLKWRKFQLPRSIAALITLVFLLSVIVGILALFAPLVANEVAYFSSIDPDLIISGIQTRLGGLSTWLDGLGLELNSADIYDYGLHKVREIMSLEGVTGVVTDAVSIVGNLITGFLAVLFMSFFFLKDASLFSKIVFRLTPERHREVAKTIISHSHKMLTRYFIGLLFQTLIMMVVVSVGCMIFGVPNALLIGIFAGLANIVPYVGPLVALLFGLVVGCSTGLAADPNAVLTVLGMKVIGVFLIAQVIDGWLVQPFVLGPSVDTHPLELFVLLLAAATIGGITAMAVALPAYVILRIIFGEVWPLISKRD